VFFLGDPGPAKVPLADYGLPEDLVSLRGRNQGIAEESGLKSEN